MPNRTGSTRACIATARTSCSILIGGMDVLEKPSVRKEGDAVIFTARSKTAPSKNPFVIRVADIPTEPASLTQPSKMDAAAAKMETPGVAIAGAPEGTRQEVVDGAILVTIPPHDQPVLFEIAISPSESIKPQAAKPTTALSELCKGAPAQWAKTVETKGTIGQGDGAYVVDSVTIPFENPYNSWIRFGGFDFFSDGRAAVTTWSGDVWIVSGIDDKLDKADVEALRHGAVSAAGAENRRRQDLRDWPRPDHAAERSQQRRRSRFLRELQQRRDGLAQLPRVRLRSPDRSGRELLLCQGRPGEPGGRGWERVTPHNGIIAKISKDGQKFEVFATGVRAPNGMGVGPNGEITNSDNEGTWTPRAG